MTSMVNRIESIGHLAEDRPYVPFLPAVEAGILRDPENLARPPENPIGVDAINGIITNGKGKGAGVVELGAGLAGVDHVSISIKRMGKLVMISSSSKESVDDEGHINGEGGVIISTTEGRVKFVTFAVDVAINPWRFYRLRRSRENWVDRKIVNLPANLILPDEYEVHETLGTNQQIVKPSQHFY